MTFSQLHVFLIHDQFIHLKAQSLLRFDRVNNESYSTLHTYAVPCSPILPQWGTENIHQGSSEKSGGSPINLVRVTPVVQKLPELC